MARQQFFVHIEGIQYLFGTKALLIDVGTTWAGYTMLGNVVSIGEMDYNLDPIKREVKVGSVDVKVQDTDTDTLTSLFGWRATEYRGWLDSTIQQADSMTGSGTITVSETIPTGTAPCILYIERETFYATGQSGTQFTGVTREKFGSTAALHVGYTGDDGYRPTVTTFPEFWTGRRAEIYRVDESDLSASGQLSGACTRVWGGPLLDLIQSDLNTWTLKVGSIMRYLEVELPRKSHPLTVNQVTGYDDSYSISLRPKIETVISGLITTAAGTSTTTYCTSLSEPDNYWHSQYALHITSGTYNDYYTPILSWEQSTGKFTHLSLGSGGTSLGDTFDIVRFNDLLPYHISPWNRVYIGDEIVDIKMAKDIPEKYWYGLMRIYSTANEVDFSGMSIGDEAIQTLSTLVMGDRAQKEFYHPIRFFLYLALSTGEGWNHATYDIFPYSHGAAIPSDWIDVTTFEEIMEQSPWPEANYTKWLEMIFRDPVKLSTILEQICVLFGVFPAIDSQGRLTLRKVRQYSEYESADANITTSEIIGTPSVSQQHTGIVRGFKYEFNFHPVDKEYMASTIVELVGVRKYYPQAKVHEIKLNLWSGDFARAYGGLYTNIMATIEEISQRLRQNSERLLNRIGRPIQIMTLRVPLQDKNGNEFGEGIVPGDLVKVTLPGLPLPDGTRGASAALFEVRGVKKNQVSNTAQLKLYWLPYRNRGAAWNFAADITSWNGTTYTMTVDDSLFESGYTAEDYVGLGNGYIRIHYLAQSRAGTAAYGYTERLRVASASANSITINNTLTPPTYTPTSDDMICADDYDNYTGHTAGLAILAFFAEANDTDILGDETVGASGDVPFVFC